MAAKSQTTELPEWARTLITEIALDSCISALSVGLPPKIFDYIVARMKREQLDAMLDAEIGR